MDQLDEIIRLFETRGQRDYLGEPVSQLEHALQTAYLATAEGASDALVAAALLHDVGHLLGPEEDPAARGIDAVHEELGGRWLAAHFGPEVTEPVRLHVAAKRYLCAVDPAYQAALSPASVRSLELQGGPMDAAHVVRFEENPYHEGAVRLRRWDDAAKISGLEVPNVRRYTDLLRRLVLSA
jgi:phosphonate degradation associated HDIG domain protein